MKSCYYMASSMSGQDEPNRVMWLATSAGKIEPSCPLRTTRCIPLEKFPRKPYNKSFIEQVSSVKMAGYWPRSFLASLLTSTSSRSMFHRHTKKELGQYPAILTSHLVNNPYILLHSYNYTPLVASTTGTFRVKLLPTLVRGNIWMQSQILSQEQ